MTWTRRHPVVAAALLAWLATGCAPGTDEAPPAGPVGSDVLQTIAQTSMESGEVSVNADTLLDMVGARISGLPSGEEAQAFVARRMEAYGVPVVEMEPFPLLGWDRREAELEVTAPAGLAAGPLNILSLGHVGSFEVEAPLIDAGFGTAEEIEALGERVDGAIVLADVGAPAGYGRGVHRTEKVSLATRAGAIGFIQLNTTPGPRIPVGVATLGDEETEIPAVAADRATGERLRGALEEAGSVSVRLMVNNWMERTEASNVIGEIPGQSDEVILVGAHLDSWDLATGAIDNGTGTLAVLEIARALTAHVRETGERPWRTIRFAFWMGEELGLYGSRYHAEVRHASGELERYRAVLNLDVVGAPVGFGAMGRPEAEAGLAPVREALVEAGFELDEGFSTGGGIYSDHQPFMMRGVPIVTVRSRQRPEAAGVSHTIDDRREVIDEPGIARTAAVSAALLWAVANAPDLGMARWSESEIGAALEGLGVRDPLERAGEWRWP